MSDARVTAEQGWSDPVVGVLGGVGPLATATFLKMVTMLTPADSDQDNLDLVVLSHATTPDRTARILDETKPDPTPVLRSDALRLQAIGAAYIVVACNTAHWFMHEVEAAVDIPVVSIVDVTAAAAIERGRALSGDQTPNIGVLATDGTRASGVYTKAVRDAGGEPVEPDAGDQQELMRIIYDQVKAGRQSDLPAFHGIIDRMAEKGCAAVILGCTELSVVYDEHRLHADPRLVDSLDSLARATITRAGRTPRATPA